jgi:hypothetical protein
MALLDSFYGDTPSYLGGLLGEDELRRLQGQAQSQSNLGMATALLRAGAPSRTPGGGALAIAEGLQMGQDTYRKALNQGLQEKMQGLQVNELIRKQQESEAVRRFLPQLMQAGQTTQTSPAQLTMRGQPTMGVVRDDEGNMLPGGAEIPAQFATGPTTINRDAYLKLALAYPEVAAKYKDLLPKIEKAGDLLYEVDPLSGKVRQVAGQAKEDLAGPVKQAMQVLGINKPFADVTAQERTLIGQYIDRQEANKQVNINMPAEGERKAAVLANRMNFGVQQLNAAIGQDPTSAMPNTMAEVAKFLTRSDFLSNKVTPEQRQVVEGTQLDILDAALTLGTGAAYTKEQLEGYRKSYFPQLGDTPATVRSKQARLQNVLESAQIASGRAAGQIPTKMPSPMVQYPETTEQSQLPGGVIVRKRQ